MQMTKQILADILSTLSTDIGVEHWDAFDVWRCFRPYPEFDRVLARHPGGVLIVFKRRRPIKFVPGPLFGPGLQYTNKVGSWYAEQQLETEDQHLEAGRMRAEQILANIQQGK